MTPAEIEAEAARLRAVWDASVAAQSYPTDHEKAWLAVAEASLRARADVTADRNFLKRREQSIIEACERVADGGQYRADIVSAIQRLRRDRDAARRWGYLEVKREYAPGGCLITSAEEAERVALQARAEAEGWGKLTKEES